MKLIEIELREYEVREATKNEKPDVIISKDRDIYDFMTLGTVCISKTLENADNVILIKEEERALKKSCELYLDLEWAGNIYENPFMQQAETLKKIARYMTGELDESLKLGVEMAILIAPYQFTTKEKGMVKLNQITIPGFRDCLDTKLAQVSVMRLIQEVVDMVCF